MTKQKLSKAQIKILKEALQEYKDAINCKNYDEYYNKYKPLVYSNAEDFKSYDVEMYNYFVNRFNLKIKGIVKVKANTKTIKKLGESDYVEVIEIGGNYLDTLKLNLDKIDIIENM